MLGAPRVHLLFCFTLLHAQSSYGKDIDDCKYEINKIHCVNDEIEDYFCNKWQNPSKKRI